MAGFFKKLVSGLTKTRDNIVHGIDNVFSGFSKIDDDFYEELEETLIMGDLGVNTTEEIIENLKEKVKAVSYTHRDVYKRQMLKSGAADGIVSGACHSTANTLRPALQIVKTKPGSKIASAFFVIDVPNCEYGENGTCVFGDCGLNQNPNPEELAVIAVSSAESFRFLVGAEPKVAMLSHSSKGSAKHADVDKVVEATRIAKELAPELKLDGELQTDAAMVPSVGASKAPGSEVAGHDNVLIFPDLDAGNIGYKLV